MICGLLAEAVLALHLFFIVFAALGGALVLRWRKLARLHLPCALWAGAIALGGWICPLTHLEVHLRRCAGQAGYREGFVAHYLLPLVYPEALTRELQVMLGMGVLCLNAAVYLLVAVRTRRRFPPGG